jgi:hypothetical protein
MEKYRLVQEHKVEESEGVGRRSQSESDYPEVRITQQGKPRNYISYAMNLLVCSLRWLLLPFLLF